MNRQRQDQGEQKPNSHKEIYLGPVGCIHARTLANRPNNSCSGNLMKTRRKTTAGRTTKRSSSPAACLLPVDFLSGGERAGGGRRCGWPLPETRQGEGGWSADRSMRDCEGRKRMGRWRWRRRGCVLARSEAGGCGSGRSTGRDSIDHCKGRHRTTQHQGRKP